VTADDDNDQEFWYVRRGASIQGPYDTVQIRRYLLLGRVRLTDRVSPDGSTWHSLTQRGALIPEEMRDLESEEGRARFEAARRAIDERDVSGGDAEARRGRRADDRRALGVSRWSQASFVAVAVLAAALGYLGYYAEFPRGIAVEPDCDAGAARSVDWSYCIKDNLVLQSGSNLSDLRALNASLRNAHLADTVLHSATLAYADLGGANLRGADLSEANLRGADLRAADLRRTSLEGANLAHADLRGARLEGASLDGADLGYAVWIDGRPCLPDSIGRCITAD